MAIFGQLYFKNNRSFLWHYLRPYGLAVKCATLCSLCLGLITTAIAMIVGPSLRILTSPNPGEQVSLQELFGSVLGRFFESQTGLSSIDSTALIYYMPFVLITLSASNAVFSTLQYYLWERVSELATKDLRQSMLTAFLHTAPLVRSQERGRQHETDLSSIVTTDIKLIREYIVHFYGGLPRELLKLTFLSITLILLSPKLFCIFFLGILPAGMIISRLGKKLRRRSSIALSDYSTLSEWLQQRLLGLETIKHYQTEKLEEEKMQRFTHELFSKFYRAARIKALSGPLLELVGITAMVLVLSIALFDIEHNRLSGSVAFSFFTSLAILAQAGATIGRYFNSNREGIAASSRVKNLLLFFTQHAEKTKLNHIQFERGPWFLKIENLSVLYEERFEALKNFSYTFESGKIYGLFGPSGSGKSTLVHTILGLVKAHSGKLLFNPEYFKEHSIGYMPQAVELFSGSLAENISYPRFPQEDEIHKAIDEVGISGFVSRLPQGIHTQVGAQGLELSGGQTQLIHLARLAYHHYPMLMIDEGTSALDPEIEKIVYQFLVKRAEKGSAIILVSHRPSASNYAHKVLYLKDGQLV